MSSEKQTGEEPVEEENSLGRRVWEEFLTLLLAVVIALGIRAVVIEPFRIPSGSMLPTLLIGDHLFVNKFVYGAQIPFTSIRLPALREPERGDVVVFRVARQGQKILPADEYPQLPKDDFVKRIVGLPGERVEVRPGGQVYIDGTPAKQRSLERDFIDEHLEPLKLVSEQLGECEHLVVDNPRLSGTSRKAFTLPEGRYFMMGDNRDNSNDSRSWGTVHFDDFKGPAFILYWSWDHAGNFLSFLNPVNWFRIDKRWDRMFQSVECGNLEAPDSAGKARAGQLYGGAGRG